MILEEKQKIQVLVPDIRTAEILDNSAWSKCWNAQKMLLSLSTTTQQEG